MKEKLFFVFVCFLSFLNLKAQSTETFETESVGSTFFTDNGKVFNITSQAPAFFDVFSYTGGGWNGTSADNRFIDNSGSTYFNTPIKFKISAAGGGPFLLKSFYAFMTRSDFSFSVTGKLIVTGRLGGVDQFIAELNGPFGGSMAINNGYTFINMANFGGANNSNTPIDEFEIQTTGNIDYFALDAMTWQCAAPVVTPVSQTNIACKGGNTGSATVSVSGDNWVNYNWTPGNPSGDGTATVTGLSAGTWTCTVTNSCGLTSSTSFTITEPTAALTATQSQTDVSCNNGSNGTATVVASGGAGSYTYSWSPFGGTSATATGLPAGNYTVTITDWNGCQIQKNFIITQPPALTATQSQTNVSCNNGSNGTASVVASGGAGSYTYSWSPFGGNNATATGLPVGDYTVTIYDWNGCQIQKNFTITQPTAMVTSISSQTNVSCNEPNSGQATVAASGGTPPYIYEWLPSGGTQETATGLAPGTYTVTVTDFNGCQKEQIVEIEGATAPVLNLDSTTSFCEGSTTQLSATSDAINITGFTGDFSSEGWQLTSNNSNGSITFSPDGTSLQMISSDNGSSNTGYHQITKTITANVTVSFNWIYTTNDGALYDYPRILINGAASAFSGFGGAATQSGTQTVVLNAGDVFGLRIESLDNYAEPATVNITNFTVSNGVSYDYLWTASEGGVISGTATNLNLVVDTPGTYTLTATNDEGCQTTKSIVVTEIPNIAPEGEEIQILTQGQTLADLTVTGTNPTWYSDEELTTEIPSTTVFVSETTYYVTQTVGECESPALAITVYDAALAGNCDSFTIWNGTTWSHGIPDTTKRAIIEGDLTISNNMSVCELLLNSGILTINSNASLTVNGVIENTQTSANFIVHSGANLIQVDDVDNIGEITTKRNVTIKHLDYTIWSSPVLGQNLQAFSPFTLPNRIRTYDTTDDTWKVIPSVGTAEFASGVGYMFRAPNADDNPGTPYLWTGNFIGLPQNGNVTYNFSNTGGYHAIGNPYPSNISYTSLKSSNPEIGSVYFWTNSNAPSNGSYVTNNWATYSIVGGAMASDNSDVLSNGIISVGQGFVAETNGTISEVSFNNQMRTGSEGVFFRTMTDEKHRLWLDLKKEDLKLNQILIGYTPDASNDFDFGVDAKLFNYSGSALYSLIDNNEEQLVIQGRSLPFEDSDIVPLGFRATTAGSYSVSLSNFDGDFAAGQDIFLKDIYTNTTHNLKNGDYSFVTEVGTFENRFEVVYRQGNMSVENPTLENSWVVYKNGNAFLIQTQGFEMSEVMVYDMLGRIIYNSQNINSDNHQFPTLDADQVLIVKIKTSENEVMSKKVKN